MLLQVDEDGLPHDPTPIMHNGKPVKFTCGKSTLHIYAEGDPPATEE